MNTFDIILQQVGLFVIYILAGLLLVKTKVLNRETLEPISKFVIKMALPLMVFINITDGTDKKNLYESWPILVIAVGFYICIYAAGAMAVKFFKLQESRVGIYRAMLLFGNIGFIGLPMISSVFPENGILYASVFMLIDQFMLWTLGVKLTSPTGEGGFKLKKMINPATVAIVLVVLWCQAVGDLILIQLGIECTYLDAALFQLVMLVCRPDGETLFLRADQIGSIQPEAISGFALTGILLDINVLTEHETVR